MRVLQPRNAVGRFASGYRKPRAGRRWAGPGAAASSFPALRHHGTPRERL